MHTDDDWLFPLLDDTGRQLLKTLREDPYAPRYTHPGCDRLSAAGLARVRAFENEIKTTPIGWQPGSPPAWLHEFARKCFSEVPFYRQYARPSADFSAIPTCERADLGREPWSFVPDPLPLDDMAVYQSSGTTGHPLNILTHPEPLACYLVLIRAALARQGAALPGGPGRVAIAQICFQKSTWTYVSISALLDQAALVKLNLSPAEWRDPDDRGRYLDACDPQIYTGDPLSFSELLRLSLRTHPQALVSTSMALSPALRAQLEAHFGCPVIDIYSMNETGPIAAAGPDGFELLHPRLFVEILRPDGSTCAPCERGEIVVSGGFNPFLPLLRYRTGDYASLRYHGRQPIICELEGRPPVVFQGANGKAINNVDVSNTLKPFALAQFNLHQSANGALRLGIQPAVIDEPGLRRALLGLFGDQQTLTIEPLDTTGAPGEKVIQYTQEI